MHGSHRKGRRLWLGAVVAAALLGWGAAAHAQTTADHTNRGVVEIEGGTADGLSGKMINDLADLLDDGATRRVLPVLGEGSLQNITDLQRLRGIDLAIIQVDALDYARKAKMPGLSSLTYVARLYNAEFHLVARDDIKSIADLKGKKVNVDVRGAGTGVTAANVFAALGLKVQTTTYATGLALAKLEKGEIDAVAYVAGKPAPIFRALDASAGLHLVSVPLRASLSDAYAPTQLTAADYPALVKADAPVDTVAVGTVLMAADLQALSERYHNVANFVDAFFTQFQTLLEPGYSPKWREVNLAAQLPGWRRFPPAAEWIARNAVVAQQKPATDIKAMFEKFLDERLRITGGPAMTQKQKDDLFAAFRDWQSSQANAASSSDQADQPSQQH